MRNVRNARTLLLAALAAVGVLAVTAGPAAAWNTTTGGAKFTGTVNIKKEGAATHKCTFPSGKWEQNGYTSGSNVLVGTNGAFGSPEYVTLTCTNAAGSPMGTFHWPIRVKVVTEGGKYMATFYGIQGFYPSGSAFGNEQWRPNNIGDWGVKSSQWINATATTPSYTVLNETLIGRGSLGPNYFASGTISFTTLAGGQLTYP